MNERSSMHIWPEVSSLIFTIPNPAGAVELLSFSRDSSKRRSTCMPKLESAETKCWIHII